jgi:hypothetical protein
MRADWRALKTISGLPRNVAPSKCLEQASRLGNGRGCGRAESDGARAGAGGAPKIPRSGVVCIILWSVTNRPLRKRRVGLMR